MVQMRVGDEIKKNNLYYNIYWQCRYYLTLNTVVNGN